MNARQLVFIGVALSVIMILPESAGAQESVARKGEKMDVDVYLRAMALKAAPDFVVRGKVRLRFRAMVTLGEIYESLWIDCVEYSGTEGANVKLRYMKRLEADLFEGDFQPGFEGVNVRILEWRNAQEVVCAVGKERYLLTCDQNPDKIKVTLLKGAQSGRFGEQVGK